MIDISPHKLLAIFPLLVVGLASIVGALVLLRFGRSRPAHGRLYPGAVLVGMSCMLASGMFRSSRHAGTGTQTTWGWPRMIYRRWESWEVVQREQGVHWQGTIENTVFYGAIALLVGALILATALRFNDGESVRKG